MKKVLVFVLVVLALFSSGCVGEEREAENIHYYDVRLEPGFEWIKNNTAEDAVITSWWDYGSMIVNSTGRDAVIEGPSRRILRTVAMHYDKTDEELEAIEGEFEDDSKVKDVAKIMLTKDPSEAAELMNKYNSEYLFISKGDWDILASLQFAASDYTDFYDVPYTEDVEGIILLRCIEEEEINGFERVYSDNSSVIYELI